MHCHRFRLRFAVFRLVFWHKPLVGAGLTVIYSDWIVSFWWTGALWPGSTDATQWRAYWKALAVICITKYVNNIWPSIVSVCKDELLSFKAAWSKLVLLNDNNNPQQTVAHCNMNKTCIDVIGYFSNLEGQAEEEDDATPCLSWELFFADSRRSKVKYRHPNLQKVISGRYPEAPQPPPKK